MSYDLDKDLMCKLVAKYSKKEKIQRADLVEIIVEYESGRLKSHNSEYKSPSAQSYKELNHPSGTQYNLNDGINRA